MSAMASFYVVPRKYLTDIVAAVTSQQLSKERGSDWLVLSASSAAQLLAALRRVDWELSDVSAFVASEHGPEGAAEEAAAVQAALITLKTWLAEVTPESVGLLSVG